MTFDIIKLIILGANCGYFLLMGVSQNSLIYIGIGILLFFAMVGILGFTSGYESLWTLLLVFVVTLPCNIKAVEMLLFDMIYKRYPDSFAMLYVTGFSHKIFRAAFSELSIWQKGFTIATGIFIFIILIMAEQYAAGLVAQLIWTEQKEDAFKILEQASEADDGQEEDVAMQLSWSGKKKNYYYLESTTSDERDDEEPKKTPKFDWRELVLEGDKPVGVIQHKKCLKTSDCIGGTEIAEKDNK